jgi:hypothetical protein
MQNEKEGVVGGLTRSQLILENASIQLHEEEINFGVYACMHACMQRLGFGSLISRSDHRRRSVKYRGWGDVVGGLSEDTDSECRAERVVDCLFLTPLYSQNQEMELTGSGLCMH